MPEESGLGQSTRRVAGSGFPPAVKMRGDGTAPQPGGKGKGAGDGKGPGQAGGLIGAGQAQGGEGPRGVQVVVGMAGGVQHHGGSEPVRGVPAVGCSDRFQTTIGQAGAGQAVVLDIVGQQDLAGGVQGKGDPGEKAGKARDQDCQSQRDKASG